MELLEFININGNFHIPVKIQGSTYYDGKHWITIDQQPETSWYIGFINNVKFVGYPDFNGSFGLDWKPKNVSPLTCVVNGCC